MNDLSDDEIMQDFALACQRFKNRFGEEDLIAAAEELIITLQSKYRPVQVGKPIPQ